MIEKRKVEKEKKKEKERYIIFHNGGPAKLIVTELGSEGIRLHQLHISFHTAHTFK